jgi:hypothetical protein
LAFDFLAFDFLAFDFLAFDFDFFEDLRRPPEKVVPEATAETSDCDIVAGSLARARAPLVFSPPTAEA